MLGGIGEPVVLAEQVPLAVTHAPPGAFVGRERLEPFALLLLGEVKPELHQQHAFVTEHLLEAVHLGDALVELGLADGAERAVENGLAVPRAEEDADAPLRRQPLPETPHGRPRALLVAGLVERVRDDVARVHPLVEQVDGLALACAFDATDEYQHGELLLLEHPVLRGEQGLAQLRLLLLPGGFVDFVGDGGGLEHATRLVQASAKTDEVLRFRPGGWPRRPGGLRCNP